MFANVPLDEYVGSMIGNSRDASPQRRLDERQILLSLGSGPLRMQKTPCLASALRWAVAMPVFAQVCWAAGFPPLPSGARFTGAFDSAWENTSNWIAQYGSPSLPPGGADTALFTGGTVTLAGDVSVGNLSVSGAPSTLRSLGVLRNLVLEMPNPVPVYIGSELTLDRLIIEAIQWAEWTFERNINLANGAGISTPGIINLNTAGGSLNATGSGSIAGPLRVVGGNTVSIGSQVELTANSIYAQEGTIDIKSASSVLQGAVYFGGAGVGIVRNSGVMSVPYLTVNTFPGALAGNRFENTGTLEKIGEGPLGFLPPAVGGYSLLNSGTLRLGGSGLVILGNGLHQTAGTLEFAGARVSIYQPVQIDGGSVVGSLSEVDGSGSMNVSSATLSPGLIAGAVGSLAFPADLVMTGGDLVIDIVAGGQADTVMADGVVLLAGGPRLGVTAPNAVSPGTSFMILSGAQLTGTFAGLNGGDTFVALGAAGQEFRIDYTEIGVALTAIPEADFFPFVLGLGLSAWAWGRRVPWLSAGRIVPGR